MAQNESESEASEESSGSSQDESDAVQSDEPIPEPPKPMPIVQREWKVQYEGRNILDLGSNLSDPKFNLRFADLPTNNLQFFFTNRSQYHRLGASGPRQEYSLDKCRCCNFEFPNIPASTANASSAGSAYQSQTQSGQNSFTYSLNNFLKNQTNDYHVQTPQTYVPPPPTPITKKNVVPPTYNNNLNGMNGNYNQKMGGGLNGYNNVNNMNMNMQGGKQNYFGGGNAMNQNTIANLLNLVNMRPTNNANTNNMNSMGNMRCYSGNNGMQGQYGLYKQF